MRLIGIKNSELALKSFTNLMDDSIDTSQWTYCAISSAQHTAFKGVGQGTGTGGREECKAGNATLLR